MDGAAILNALGKFQEVFGNMIIQEKVSIFSRRTSKRHSIKPLIQTQELMQLLFSKVLFIISNKYLFNFL
jgi:hypothetical protein